jgi:hypothetical protein
MKKKTKTTKSKRTKGKTDTKVKVNKKEARKVAREPSNPAGRPAFF